MCGNRPIIKLCALNNLMAFPISICIWSVWIMFFLFLFVHLSILTIDWQNRDKKPPYLYFCGPRKYLDVSFVIWFHSLSQPTSSLLSPSPSSSSHIEMCVCMWTCNKGFALDFHFKFRTKNNYHKFSICNLFMFSIPSLYSFVYSLCDVCMYVCV